MADLEVTSKAVERTADAIGVDIAANEQQEDSAPCGWINRSWTTFWSGRRGALAVSDGVTLGSAKVGQADRHLAPGTLN